MQQFAKREEIPTSIQPGSFRHFCRFVVVFLLLTFGFSSTTFAQSSVTGSRTISIGMAVALSAYADKATSFGTVDAGTGAQPAAAYNNSVDDPSTATIRSSPGGTLSGFRLRANRLGRIANCYIICSDRLE